MVGVEDDGRRVEVVGELGVVLLTGRVADEVHGPPEELLGEEVDQDEERCVANGLLQLELPGLGDVEAFDVLGRFVKLGVLELIAGPGHEDFVTSEMSSGSVVTAVRDPPRVVRDGQSRVQDPSDGVVDGLTATKTQAGVRGFWAISESTPARTLEGEKAWWPHSWAMTHRPVAASPERIQ